jgi:hypothetical protein
MKAFRPQLILPQEKAALLHRASSMARVEKWRRDTARQMAGVEGVKLCRGSNALRRVRRTDAKCGLCKANHKIRLELDEA